MKNTEKFWDRISKSYDKNDDVDPTYLKMLDVTRKYLKNDSIVMDLGCATGSISIDISDDAEEVLGIDISSKMVEIAKRKAVEFKKRNVKFEQATIFDERLEMSSFDTIMAFNILHLLDDTKSAIVRIDQLLKPGGIFISSTVCLGDKGLFVSGLLTMIGKLGFIPDPKIFKRSELKDMMVQGGFKILETVDMGDPSHPFIVARKEEL